MHRLRPYVPLAAAGILIAWLAMVWYPVRNFPTRAGITACVVAFPLILLALVWKWRAIRWSLVALLLILVGFPLFPGSAVNSDHLRERYTAAIARYVGSRYVWGGENRRGIDCSGLIRAAMFDACIGEGLRTLNPALLRHALWLWWNDASAHELSQGYGGQVTGLGPPMPLADAEALMQPGDFATWPDGVHVIAQLRGSTWIQADPEANRVELFAMAGNAARERQFARPCRWRILQSQ